MSQDLRIFLFILFALEFSGLLPLDSRAHVLGIHSARSSSRTPPRKHNCCEYIRFFFKPLSFALWQRCARAMFDKQEGLDSCFYRNNDFSENHGSSKLARLALKQNTRFRKKFIIAGFFLLFGLTVNLAFAAIDESIPLKQAHINLHDHASLQRGAKYYMNYCAGCHSLKYMRYEGMAHDIGILNEYGEVDHKLVEKYLIFTGAKMGDLIQNAMPSSDANEWFGIAPPDLTLVTRVRGINWVYTYLLSFYQDNSKMWGTNNWLYVDVAMPNVLGLLQGDQIPIYREKKVTVNGETQVSHPVDHLQLRHNGQLNQPQFEALINDIVNFLAYSAEPAQLKRYGLGVGILLFLAVFLILAYLLKQVYWKQLK